MKREEIITFYEQVKKGNVLPFYRSEKPFDNTDKLIKDVTRDTFNEIVLRKDKDVVMMYYHPGNYQCEEFDPIYEEASRRLKNNPNLVFARLNIR